MESIVGLITQVALVASGIASGLAGVGESTTSVPTTESNSVELGIVELSPRGEAGGFAMPASGSSAPPPRPDLTVTNPAISATRQVGTAITFSATVFNTGTAASGGSHVRFRVQTVGGSGVANLDVGVSGLAINGNQARSTSWTPTSPGTYRVRAETDVFGAVTESNEGNNITAWSNFTVTGVPSAPTTLNVSCRANAAATIDANWNTPANTTYFAVRINDRVDGWSGVCNPAGSSNDYCADTGATSIAWGITPNVQTDVWVHACNGAGCSPDSISRSITCGADLRVDTQRINGATSGSFLIDSPVDLSARFLNVGNSRVTSGYHVGFDILDAAGTTVVESISTQSIGAGPGAPGGWIQSNADGGNGNSNTTRTISWTPTAVGNYQIRADTDVLDILGAGLGQSVETDENNNQSGTIGFTVFAPTPVVTIDATPNPIGEGSTADITWTSTGYVDSCTASNGDSGWSGSLGTSGGTYTTEVLTSDTLYQISCTGPGGTTVQDVTVSVIQRPEANLQVCRWDGSSATDCQGDGGELLIAEGDDIRVSWDGGSEPSTVCVATSGKDFSTANARSGDDVITSLVGSDSPEVYGVECSNIAGTVAESATVRIGQACTPYEGLSAPELVRAGDQFTVTWQKPVDIANCTLQGGTLNEVLSEVSPSPDQCVVVSEGPISVENRTTFNVECDYPVSPDIATVNVVPRIEEI
ncbi:MAG: CARDB domain-containing protein [Patescibacteria group bacterium]